MVYFYWVMIMKNEINISKTAENIKKHRELRSWSQEELAEKMGYKDRSTIAKIESGSSDLTQTRIASFAKIFGISAADLMGFFDDLPKNIIPMPKMNKIPLLGEIACGVPIYAEENFDGEVEVPDHVKADFALKCKGDSMINARIFDNDVVYIRKQSIVENGQIAAVLIDDEATLKRVWIYEDHITLEAENPTYRPFVYWGTEMNDITILGKAVAFTSSVR